MSAIHRLIAHFGSDTALARAVNVSQPTVHAWKTGKHGVSPLKAMEIERITNGQFGADEFCPALAEHKNIA